MCGGVDCAGSGSGAALLEIEELCAEERESDGSRPLLVAQGVCTLQCANAPVVNVHETDAVGYVSSRHHSKVDGPERCAVVLEDAAGRASIPVGTDSGPMLRRAHGLRWHALRQRTRRPHRSTAAPSRELTLALQAEARAASADPRRLARAERRAERFGELGP